MNIQYTVVTVSSRGIVKDDASFFWRLLVLLVTYLEVGTGVIISRVVVAGT